MADVRLVSGQALHRGTVIRRPSPSVEAGIVLGASPVAANAVEVLHGWVDNPPDAGTFTLGYESLMRGYWVIAAPSDAEKVRGAWGLPDAEVSAGIAMHQRGEILMPKTQPYVPAERSQRRLPIVPADETTPGFRRGAGEWKDCARYEDCPDTFARAAGRGADAAARCPTACAAFQPERLDVAAFLRPEGASSSDTSGLRLAPQTGRGGVR